MRLVAFVLPLVLTVFQRHNFACRILLLFIFKFLNMFGLNTHGLNCSASLGTLFPMQRAFFLGAFVGPTYCSRKISAYDDSSCWTGKNDLLETGFK